MSSAIYFNLDQSNLLSSGKGLKSQSLFAKVLIDCMLFDISFQQYFSYIAAASRPIYAFLEFFLTSTVDNILSKLLAAFSI